MPNSIFLQQENPPLEIRLLEGKFTQGDRDFFTAEMTQLMTGPYPSQYPVSQVTTLRRTFDPAKAKDIGQPLHWHIRASIRLTSSLQEQLSALDHWYNWLLRYDFQPYQSSWRQFFQEYWLARERFQLPHGDAGFREIHRAMRQARNLHTARHQLMYTFSAGRITLFTPSEPSLGNLAASFRQPPLLHPVEPLILYMDCEHSIAEILNTTVRLKRAVLLRPAPEFSSFLPTAQAGNWPALLSFGS
jgi:hypothetical protein